MTTCTKCFVKIEGGEGRFNYPTGVQCNKCGEEYYEKNLKGMKLIDVHGHFKRQEKIGKMVKIGGYDIPKELINIYVDKVAFTRRAGIYAIGSEDPIIVMNALKEREKAHRIIFKHVGLDYPDVKLRPKSLKFQRALSDYLDELKVGEING